MLYGLDENGSVEGMLDYVAGVIAGLESLSETTDLAEPWIGKRQALRLERDTRDDDRWALLGASAKVDVRDTLWDDCIGQISSRSFYAAGKKATEPPYAALFGSVDARQAKRLGTAKATTFGRMVVSKMRQLKHPDLEGLDGRLEERNHELERATNARTEAKEKAAQHEIRRELLLDELESLAASTEVGILTRFPGSKLLARAILSVKKPRTAEAKDDTPSPEPA